jgi:hypothetical protein
LVLGLCPVEADAASVTDCGCISVQWRKLDEGYNNCPTPDSCVWVPTPASNTASTTQTFPNSINGQKAAQLAFNFVVEKFGDDVAVRRYGVQPKDFQDGDTEAGLIEEHGPSIVQDGQWDHFQPVESGCMLPATNEDDGSEKWGPWALNPFFKNNEKNKELWKLVSTWVKTCSIETTYGGMPVDGHGQAYEDMSGSTCTTVYNQGCYSYSYTRKGQKVAADGRLGDLTGDTFVITTSGCAGARFNAYIYGVEADETTICNQLKSDGGDSALYMRDYLISDWSCTVSESSEGTSMDSAPADSVCPAAAPAPAAKALEAVEIAGIVICGVLVIGLLVHHLACKPANQATPGSSAAAI